MKREIKNHVKHDASSIFGISGTLSAATELTKRGSTAEIAQARILRTKAEGIERRGLSTKEGMERYTAGLQESLATPSTATTSDPQYRAAFHRYVYDGALGMPEVQKRTLEVGTQRSPGRLDPPVATWSRSKQSSKFLNP